MPLLYGIDERPNSWLESIFYGWQHTLVDISPFVLPLAVAAALGMSGPQQAELISFCLFSMGIATLIQTTLGSRLPVIQGPSGSIIATLAPTAGLMGAGAMWGAILIGSLSEMLLGATGVLRRIRRALNPVLLGVVILAIGLSLSRVALRLAIGAGTWSNLFYALAVIILIGALKRWAGGALGGLLARGSIFFAIWVVGLLVGSFLGDVDWPMIASQSWLRLPQLFPYGGPGFGWTLAPAAIVAVLAGFAASMVESVGDYGATCTVSGRALEDRHVDRGIFAEGLGCLAASLFGGLPCTSYTQNIGVIAGTGIASRFVVQIAAVFLVLYGVCPKFGALLAAIPRSTLGGVFIVVCAMIALSGLRLIETNAARTSDKVTSYAIVAVALSVAISLEWLLSPEVLSSWPTALSILLTNPILSSMALGLALSGLIQSQAHSKPGARR